MKDFTNKKQENNLINLLETNSNAMGLNNSSVQLLAYSYANINLTFDLAGGNTGNGTSINIWNRHADWNQRFSFQNNNEIRIAGKCLDAAGGNLFVGTRIQLYDCNGTNAQKWYSNGLNIKPLANTSLCMGVSSLVAGRVVYLYGCDGSSTQRSVFGSNDFATQRWYRAYSHPSLVVTSNLTGHSISTFGNDFNGLTNTFSSWNELDNVSSNTGRFNNMADNDVC